MGRIVSEVLRLGFRRYVPCYVLLGFFSIRHCSFVLTHVSSSFSLRFPLLFSLFFFASSPCIIMLSVCFLFHLWFCCVCCLLASCFIPGVVMFQSSLPRLWPQPPLFSNLTPHQFPHVPLMFTSRAAFACLSSSAFHFNSISIHTIPLASPLYCLPIFCTDGTC